MLKLGSVTTVWVKSIYTPEHTKENYVNVHIYRTGLVLGSVFLFMGRTNNMQTFFHISHSTQASVIKQTNRAHKYIEHNCFHIK